MRSSTDNFAASSAREQVSLAFDALHLLPLHYTAKSQKMAARRWLSEVSGISESRIARTNKQYRTSTLAKSHQHAVQHSRQWLIDRGYSEADTAEQLATCRELEEGGGSSWAFFWHGLDDPAAPHLEQCVAAGQAVDLLLAGAQRCVEADDVAGVVTMLSEFARKWLHSGDEENDARLHLEDWEAVSNWDQLWKLTAPLLDALWIDQFARFDAAWGAYFVNRMEPLAVLSLVAPRYQGGRRVERPVRRLLQLSWAMLYWAKHLKWPATAPGPSVIGEAIGQPARTVMNFFDGTRTLALLEYEAYWDKMVAALRLEQPYTCPAPLAAIALAWEQTLVDETPEHKLRSVTILTDGYRRLWASHRGQLQRTPKPGVEPWPDWATLPSAAPSG